MKLKNAINDVLAGGVLPAPKRRVDGHTILTITDNGGGIARVTTASAHGLSNGNLIAITGNSVGGYNNGGLSVTVVSATVFDLDISYISNGTGGTWV